MSYHSLCRHLPCRTSFSQGVALLKPDRLSSAYWLSPYLLGVSRISCTAQLSISVLYVFFTALGPPLWCPNLESYIPFYSLLAAAALLLRT